ncbi:uncharacterized protein LOC108732495 isoform X2 [Agrilus planipennis]|uniref:Uncharacterized protein LOC108732495 isoform X2 n=1 Tax=Agrilus planipennis TaxID=224129 RepID=A0A1W4W3Y7_AGRPL|nr:uncharacterized protein LOC108732495 isoform X2 [Agrilus planipennis]
MQKPNGQLVLTSTTSTADGSSLSTEPNSNVILLRSSKLLDHSHILLRTDNVSFEKTDIVLENNSAGESKVSQLIVNQRDLAKGVVFHSIKRLGNGAPFLLLSGDDSASGHILIQTSEEPVKSGKVVKIEASDEITVEKAHDEVELVGRNLPIGSVFAFPGARIILPTRRW